MNNSDLLFNVYFLKDNPHPKIISQIDSGRLALIPLPVAVPSNRWNCGTTVEDVHNPTTEELKSIICSHYTEDTDWYYCSFSEYLEAKGVYQELPLKKFEFPEEVEVTITIKGIGMITNLDDGIKYLKEMKEKYEKNP